MKFLHVTDLHGNMHWYAWLLSHCAGTAYDAIFLTGDLINLLGRRPNEERAEVEQWTAAMRETGTKLFLCSGNHDMWHDSGSWSWIKAQHGTFFLDGLTVSSVPWLVFPWNWEEKKREFDALQAAVRKVPQPWIVLQHCPSFATKVATQPAPTHRDDVQLSLLAWEPDFLLSGHIHTPQHTGGDWTDTIIGASKRVIHLFNPCVAYRQSPRPNHIVLDLTLKTATWTRYEDRAKEVVEKVRVKTW